MKKLSIAILMITQLTSCASYQEDFECKAGKGVGCKSISEVNDMVNRGEVVGKVTEGIPTDESEKFSLLTYNMNPTLAKDKVYRTPERTARIWINSFTDEKGDYVSETYVHTVIAPGTWKEGQDE
jgi:hypothetical protein